MKLSPFLPYLKMLNAKLLLFFQSLCMMQHSATLKSKSALLEKEAWGCFMASLVGTKTSSLWDVLFDEIPEFEEEEGPPSKKIYLEDEPSTNSDPLDPKPSATPLPKIEIIFPINEGSLHESGISQGYLPIWEQLLHRKAVHLCGFQCGYHMQSRATICTYTNKEHLNTMLGCPYCDHHMWSAECGLSMFIPIILSSLCLLKWG